LGGLKQENIKRLDFLNSENFGGISFIENQ